MKPEEQMLICAVRYALGRRSYIVSDACEFVASVSDKLSKKCIGIIVRDIEEKIKKEIEFYHSLGVFCGDKCDEQEWLALLEVLKGKV